MIEAEKIAASSDLEHMETHPRPFVINDLPIPSSSSPSPYPASPTGIADLPLELLPLIFWKLRPLFTTGASIGIEKEYVEEYNLQLKLYGDLRLVCVLWHEIITPIFYDEVAFRITPTTEVKAIGDLFASKAPFITSVIFFGTGGRGGVGFPGNLVTLPRDFGRSIARSLCLCTRLRSLQCFGNHPTFTDRRWLPKFAPTIVSTVTFLVISPHQPDFDLCHSLVGLGRTLEKLEIYNWQRDWREQPLPFHLPSAFPRLTDLTLSGGYPPLERVMKLFARITAKGETALRSLIIWDVPNIAKHIPEMLSMKNLGRNLTTLHFHSWRGEQLDSAFPMTILSLCPKLIDFAYISPVVGSSLDNLSHTSLKHLGLLTHRDRTMSVSPIDIAKFILSRRCSSLRTLAIFSSDGTAFLTPDSDADDAVLLRSVCEEVGARIAQREFGALVIMFHNTI